ncbi:hypothetical protein RND71_041024 [Anisodus tanguticus]|uniref:Uncharacterized protein n=1 Tax=Anisodus tanguticus TaxID=243964 RepID=A0AAE1UQS9_9SOLA|nr:hypothetical protein RND71_041024 [Anisodus tanguticus]
MAGRGPGGMHGGSSGWGPLGFTGLLRSGAIAPQLGLGGLLGASGRGPHGRELHEVAFMTSEDGGIRPSPGLGELPVAGGTKGRLSHGGGGPPCNAVHLAMEDHLNWGPKVPGMTNMQLLARCYLQNQQAYAAYHVQKGKSMAESRYLFALSCFQMGLLTEAEKALNEPAAEVPNGAAGHYLLGLIYRYTDRRNSSIQHFNQALLLDPLLWAAYEELCILLASTDAQNEASMNIDISPRQSKHTHSNNLSGNYNGAAANQNLAGAHTNMSFYSTPSPMASQLSGVVPPPV